MAKEHPGYPKRVGAGNLESPADLVSVAKLDCLRQCVARGGETDHSSCFAEGYVSLGRAAELCATPLAAFMDFAAGRGAPLLNYGVEECEEDRRTLRKLRL
jgi:hypothetical protein